MESISPPNAPAAAEFSSAPTPACRWQHDHLIAIVKALDIKLVILHARWEGFDDSVNLTEAQLRARLMDTLSALSDTGAKAVILGQGDRVARVDCPAASVEIDTEADWTCLHFTPPPRHID